MTGSKTVDNGQSVRCKTLLVLQTGWRMRHRCSSSTVHTRGVAIIWALDLSLIDSVESIDSQTGGEIPGKCTDCRQFSLHSMEQVKTTSL